MNTHERVRHLAGWTIALCIALFTVACDDDGKQTATDSEVIDGTVDGDAVVCTPGDAGCECAAGGECIAPATCNADNVCVLEDCTPGSLGCACAAGDSCTNAADECVGGVCVVRTDCTGDLGCACDAGDTCNDDLSCDAGICTSPNAVLVSVSGGDARACDLRLVTSDGRHIDGAEFPAGVRGATRVRNHESGIALIRTSDTALSGIVAGVVLAGDDPTASTDVSIASSTCYDRLGNPDATTTVEIR